MGGVAAGGATHGGRLTLLEGEGPVGAAGSLGDELAVRSVLTPPVAETGDGADCGQEQSAGQTDAHQRRCGHCNNITYSL